DGSPLAEQAIPYGAALAGSDGALVFFEVTSDAHGGRSEHSPAEAALGDAASRWGATLAAPPQFEVAAGDPAEEILKGVDRLGCELIVMASHGRGAVGRLRFGSVADRVSRASHVPVLIVRPTDTKPKVGPVEIRRLLVPLDGSPLAAEALPVAMSVATHL